MSASAELWKKPSSPAKRRLKRHYCVPQVCQDIPYNTKSDMWSFGCVVYELCTLTQAFKGNNLLSVVNKICAGKYAPISEAYSTSLRQLVDALLQTDPANRPTSGELLLWPFVKHYIAKNHEAMERTFEERRCHS
jgi:NIMA (never in mitosis gene a)-related kinase